SDVVLKLISISNIDWDAYERSWGYQRLPLIPLAGLLIEASYDEWVRINAIECKHMQALEEKNNLLFINAYDLTGELTPQVPIEQITLTVNPSCRYGGDLTEDEKSNRFREDTMKEVVSYSI